MYLFCLVVAVLVTVGQVKSCKFLSQFLLRAGDGVQSRVQLSVTGTLSEIPTVRTDHKCSLSKH